MIASKSWALIFLCYVVVALTIVSVYNSGRRSDYSEESALFSSLGKRENTKELFFRVHRLGISGRSLIRFFRRHLLLIINIDQKEKSKQMDGNHVHDDAGVSQLYDIFKRYMYSAGPYYDSRRGSELAKCCPANSMISRLTKDVDPLPIHSHNDYWRDLPLFEALAYGCSSIEADVWIVPEIKTQRESSDKDDTDVTKQFSLAVGHNDAYLDSLHQTLDKLYTDPIKHMLDQVNCLKKNEKYGLFFNSPETTLFFYIDFKSNDNEMLYHLLMDKYLKPLIDSEYLSFYDDDTGKIVYNPITVILTGDYPSDMKVINNGNGNHGYFYTGKRHVFLDADFLRPDSANRDTSITSSASLAKILKQCHSSEATVTWRGRLIHPEISCIRSKVEENHKRGFKTRIWGVPSWPDHTERTLWRQILSLHSDILNVDDLRIAASRF